MASISCGSNNHESKLLHGIRDGEECRFCGENLCLQKTAGGNGCTIRAGHWWSKHSNGHAGEGEGLSRRGLLALLVILVVILAVVIPAVSQ